MRSAEEYDRLVELGFDESELMERFFDAFIEGFGPTILVARGGEYAPLVIPLPKTVMKCEKGSKVHIYTDGERAYIEKLEEPKL